MLSKIDPKRNPYFHDTYLLVGLQEAENEQINIPSILEKNILIFT